MFSKEASSRLRQAYVTSISFLPRQNYFALLTFSSCLFRPNRHTISRLPRPLASRLTPSPPSLHLGLGRIALMNDESASRPRLNCTINCTLRAWYATVSSAIGRPWPKYRFLETVFGSVHRADVALVVYSHHLLKSGDLSAQPVTPVCTLELIIWIVRHRRLFECLEIEKLISFSRILYKNLSQCRQIC